MQYTTTEVEDCKDGIACFYALLFLNKLIKKNKVKTYPEESDALG
jgi:hypothetical protein